MSVFTFAFDNATVPGAVQKSIGLGHVTGSDQFSCDQASEGKLLVILLSELLKRLNAWTNQTLQLKPVTDTNPPYLGFIKKLSQFSHSPTVTLCHLSTA
jgi:hypothetical protein